MTTKFEFPSTWPGLAAEHYDGGADDSRSERDDGEADEAREAREEIEHADTVRSICRSQLAEHHGKGNGLWKACKLICEEPDNADYLSERLALLLRPGEVTHSVDAAQNELIDTIVALLVSSTIDNLDWSKVRVSKKQHEVIVRELADEWFGGIV